jgi:hypothetical protein
MGGAGPPDCDQEGCESKGEHDTFLDLNQGVIEVTVDDQEFEIKVSKVTKTRGWSRKDLDIGA